MASALCRAALHLQLTTELVTAAAAAGAEEAATESMWQRIGSLAVRHAIAWGLGLLTALSGCGLERPSGEATACPHPHCIRSFQMGVDEEALRCLCAACAR